MNIISCDSCGIVLDLNRLNFPDAYDDDGKVIRENAVFEDGRWNSFVECPVCNNKILEDVVK